MLVCRWKATKGLYDKESTQLTNSVSRGNDTIMSHKEHRDVVVTDIPGAFLHEDMEGTVHLLLKGIIAVKLDPRLHRKDVWHNQR